MFQMCEELINVVLFCEFAYIKWIVVDSFSSMANQNETEIIYSATYTITIFTFWKT